MKRCRCHPVEFYASCDRCPACGHWSLDRLCGMCERRKCGHVVTDEQAVLALDTAVALRLPV